MSVTACPNCGRCHDAGSEELANEPRWYPRAQWCADCHAKARAGSTARSARIEQARASLAGALYALASREPGLFWARSEARDALKVIDELLAEQTAAEKAGEDA